ncbi:HIT-like domain-containing protein [Cantharellus anzutake]|uniref:HIT-like domain-containing protein n=1 Tax=Cantharellus anzutake TaxID=1750568 RepID=UPI001908DC2A|nr:HIT-like domain-containing protein [Cantharellus anzutake]KAF8333515.1 HIT-like domain-containing protein [Cantharellus anzutake]
MPSKAQSLEPCAFCNIIEGTEPSYKIYETDYVVGFLDIQPARRGHVLIIPKVHIELFSQLPEKYAAALGDALVKVSKALTLALDNQALTVTLNQVYAQVVPHAHFHIVPAPDFRSTSTSARVGNNKVEVFPGRHQLDDDDAIEVAKMIKSRL